jgi:UDP-N-acetylmuramoyl-tripeptide--D-alanyl-D-alanine ligase
LANINHKFYLFSTMDLYKIYQACGGAVVTDTRKVTQGCLFVALRGERFDGNAFAAQALASGAKYALIDDAAVAEKGDERYVLVADTLTALQELAVQHRQELVCPVIGITGSNGKTTTKELVNLVLQRRYKTHCTAGNLNNHIGVPLTLLSAPLDTELLVVEMGANHQGEIAALSEIAQPTHGIITSIGKAHLEGFGGLEGVKKGKSELYKYLAQHNGTAFVNAEQEHLCELLGDLQKIIYYGSHSTTEKPLDYTGTLVSAEPFLDFSFDYQGSTTVVQSHLFGYYNYGNMLTAVAVGLYFGVSPADIKMALQAYIPENNRAQIIERDSNTYILDAYNANPTSMQAAIAQFAKMPHPNKVLVLGGMRELGDYAAAEHQAIVELAQTADFNAIFLVGNEFAAFATPNIYYFDDTNALKNHLDKNPLMAAHVLIKGSRGIQLEKML